MNINKVIYGIIIFLCGVFSTPTAGKLYNLLTSTGSTMLVHCIAVSALFLFLIYVVSDAWRTIDSSTTKYNMFFVGFRLVGGIGAIWFGGASLPYMYTDPINILYNAILGGVGLYAVVVMFYVGFVPSARNKHISHIEKEQ